MCENQKTVFNESSNLIYVDTQNAFKACRCFLKSSYFTITLQDVRLQTEDDQNCSSAILRINSVNIVCDDQNNSFTSSFKTEFERTLDRVFISVTKTSLADTIQMIWLDIQSNGNFTYI